MVDDPLDLSPLDPTTDPARFARRLAEIGARAAEPLAARRANATGVLGALPRWRRPMLAAAAVVALISIAALVRVDVPNRSSATGVAEAIGVPQGLASWVRADSTPDPAELLAALQGYR
jgi:anti-sigma-K factor RskA